MVGNAVILPIEEDDVVRLRGVAAILPAASVLEPLHSGRAVRELGDGSRLDVATLVGAPAHEAGAPFDAAPEAVP